MKTAIKITLINLFLASTILFSGCKKGDTSEQGPLGPPGAASLNPINYPTVNIFNQRWMSKNLDVTTYRNGDAIPQVTDATAWAALTTGAYCYYNNDSASYAAIYGKLYNWYAVNDPRGLASLGWHIPTDIEWNTLENNCLVGFATAGGPLKEAGTTHWNAPNTDATNSTGFAGLPGGARLFNGTFAYIGDFGLLWSSTENDAYTARYCYLSYNNSFIYNNNHNKLFGFSVRFLRD